MAIQSIQSDASEIYNAAQLGLPPEIIPQFSREDTPTLSNIFNSLFNFNIQSMTSLGLTPPTEATTEHPRSDKSIFLTQLACFTDDIASMSLTSEVANEILQLSFIFSSHPTEFEQCMSLLVNITLLLTCKESNSELTTQLYSELTKLFKEWSSRLRTEPTIATRLMDLVYVLLSSHPVTLSLSITVDFIRRYVNVLMTYCTEGYLSDNPKEFFDQLIEFISSLSEHGIKPDEAIQENLANLFGPFFGVRSHSVSCRLLEFGYLSICSQHKKLLLTEGIHHIVNVWRLFPPIDKVIIQETAAIIHHRSLKVCESILNDIISKLPIGEPESHDMSHDDYEEEEDIFPIQPTEMERLRDNDLRTLVLVRLLELACAMVRYYNHRGYMCFSLSHF